MTARRPLNAMSSSSNVSRTHMTTPAAVPPACSAVPPIASGFPVTDAVMPSPRAIEIVSMSQPMTRPSVFTSGAGTSLSGPSIGRISQV